MLIIIIIIYKANDGVSVLLKYLIMFESSDIVHLGLSKRVLTVQHIQSTCTKYEQLSHILLHSPKRIIFTDIKPFN